jgi:hypothetical protein
MYLDDNWRAFRTWGVSGISPWEHEHFWKLRDGVDKRRRELKTGNWDNLAAARDSVPITWTKHTSAGTSPSSAADWDSHRRRAILSTQQSSA